jgi:hypothetical protein
MQNLSGDVLQRVLQQLWSIWVNSSWPDPGPPTKRMFYGLVPNVSKDWRRACEAINVEIYVGRELGDPGPQVDPERNLCRAEFMSNGIYVEHAYYNLLKRLVQRFPAARTLVLRCDDVHLTNVNPMSGWTNVMDVWLDQAHSLRLTKLSLENCDVRWESVARLIDQSPFLTDLHLVRMHWGQFRDSEGGMTSRRRSGWALDSNEGYLAEGFLAEGLNVGEQRERLCTAITSKYSTLTRLSMKNAAWLNDADTASLIRKLPNLERLNLAGICWAWEFGPGAHPAQATMVAISELTQLRALDLSANTPDVGVGLCEETFSGLSKCKNLELLCFGVRPPYQWLPTKMFTKWRHVVGVSRASDPMDVRLVQHRGERLLSPERFQRLSLPPREVSLRAVCRLLRSLPNLVICHGNGVWPEVVQVWDNAQKQWIGENAMDEMHRIVPNPSEYFTHSRMV